MSRPWADQPYHLISTLPFSKDRITSPAHNGIIRGLNSIYLQAPNIPRKDKTVVQDFLKYCQCWCESMHHHHDAEEERFFPSIERVSRIKGPMERNVEQHRAFTPGFEAFQQYVDTCQPANYDGTKVRSLVEAFGEPLTKHLYEEIDTLLALDKYDSGRIMEAYRQFEKALMETDKVCTDPYLSCIFTDDGTSTVSVR